MTGSQDAGSFCCFKADGKRSTKYALEALYLILQVNAFLSPRQAYRLMWNCTVHGEDANTPLDLNLEHNNRMAKEAIKKFGCNINEKSVTRIIKAQQTASKMLHSVITVCFYNIYIYLKGILFCIIQ